MVKNEAGKYGYHAHYAVKANANPRILSIIAENGLGADCVSGGDTETATEIHIFDPDTTCFQVFLYFVYTNHQVTESRHVRDLRTDMEMNTDQFHIFQIRQVIQMPVSLN